MPNNRDFEHYCNALYHIDKVLDHGEKVNTELLNTLKLDTLDRAYNDTNRGLFKIYRDCADHFGAYFNYFSTNTLTKSGFSHLVLFDSLNVNSELDFKMENEIGTILLSKNRGANYLHLSFSPSRRKFNEDLWKTMLDEIISLCNQEFMTEIDVA